MPDSRAISPFSAHLTGTKKRSLRSSSFGLERFQDLIFPVGSADGCHNSVGHDGIYNDEFHLEFSRLLLLCVHFFSLLEFLINNVI